MPATTPDLPFLFAVSTSDHQCEAFDPARPDIWDEWERRSGLTPRGRATDFWNRYPEDIARARALGCNAFRFSIAWARVEPEPGRFDPAALDHYAAVVDAIRAAGMEPIVTLHHWTWPLHVEVRGGMRSESFPEWFGAYAAAVARRLGRKVRLWITLNEPNALPFGYFRFWWMRRYPMPPGLEPAEGTPRGEQAEEELRAVAATIRHLFLAHAAARRALRAENPDAMAAANPCVLGYPDWFQRWVDRRLHRREPGPAWARPGFRLHRGRIPLLSAARHRLALVVARLDAFFTLANTNWWHLGIAGRLPALLCPPECVGAQDFVPIDYYWGTCSFRPGRLLQLVDAMQQRFDRAPVWAGGLYEAIRHHARLFPHQMLLVAENGCPRRVNGIDPETYLRRHWAEVERARRDGCRVGGYVYWSLTTTREWGLPCAPETDFGLYHIDLDGDPTLTRWATRTAEVFAEIIARARAAEEAAAPAAAAPGAPPGRAARPPQPALLSGEREPAA